MPNRGTVPPSPLVMLTEPTSARAEAFRVLRARLDQAGAGPLHTLLITSPTTRERRHLLAANLAVAWAESGSSVVAVDADLHQPQLHQLFSLEAAPGLLQSVSAGSDVGQALQPGPLPGLSVLTAGGVEPVPARVLGGKEFDEILANLCARAERVILVAPPALPVADASILASRLDGVVLLCSAYRTSRASLREAKARMEGVNARILGAVLDNAPAMRAY